ncbi:MAG: alkaline phosphatase [Clostridia bacterium]|nr:alkaline phosphatase [Clostridia bacterium]
MAFNYKHVIIIGIDGAGNFYRNTDTPGIHKMFEEGAGSDYCLTSVPTDSSECWGSMLIGVQPKVHELTNGTISDVPYKHGKEHPTVFKVIRDAHPDAKLGSFSNWSPINTSIADDGIGIVKRSADDQTLLIQICDFIKKEKPEFLFIQFDSIDGAGHTYGYNTERYLEELNVADGFVTAIRKAVAEAGIEEDTLVIATADHGGNGYGHGGPTDGEKYVFFAAVGKTVPKGKKIDVRVIDMPAIVAYALGVPADPHWDSVVPEGLFE